jgi:peptidoglycan biosynthesis protein MviN/MurJ (putative lipid II flippase)
MSQKQIYFFPFGARITDVLVLCVLYFPQMQHTEELWLYIGTVSGGILHVLLHLL